MRLLAYRSLLPPRWFNGGSGAAVVNDCRVDLGDVLVTGEMGKIDAADGEGEDTEGSGLGLSWESGRWPDTHGWLP